MNIRTLLAAFLLICGLATMADAQVKIGHSNLEFILANHPKARAMEGELASYERKLSERIKIKDDYLKQKYEEYQECVQRNCWSPEVLKQKEQELVELDREVKEMAQKAEFDLMAKQQELLSPILEQIQTAIETVAKEKGYTYILNQTTSAGVSTILYGGEDDAHDVTEDIMAKLGIPMPKEEGQ